MTTTTPQTTLTSEAADALARKVLGAADTLDADQFVAFFSPETTFRWGGQDQLHGKDAVHGAISGFWTAANIAAMRHDVKSVCTGTWASGPIVSVEADTIYTRGDGVVTVPVNSTMRLRDGLIVDYRIFGDASPVFA